MKLASFQCPHCGEHMIIDRITRPQENTENQVVEVLPLPAKMLTRHIDIDEKGRVKLNKHVVPFSATVLEDLDKILSDG